jgi:hypothetical protein
MCKKFLTFCGLCSYLEKLIIGLANVRMIKDIAENTAPE